MIKQALDTYVLANKKLWAHDRTKSVGASEIGSCARRIFYIKTEQPHDDDYTPEWGASARGEIIEAHLWVPALRKKYGKRLKFAGSEQKTLFDLPLSATPDGILTGLKSNALKHLGVPEIGSTIMAECKSADPRTNLDTAKRNNVYQTQIQMGIVRKKTKFKPTHSLLSYMDASFPDRVAEFVIPFNPDIYEAGRARAGQILSAKKASELKPEGWIAGGSECRHCPFLKACGIERRNLPFQEQPVDPQFRAEIADMVRLANRLEEKVDDYSKQLCSLQDDIKNRLREKGVKKIPGILTWSSVKGRLAYDDKGIRLAAAAAGVDVESFSRVGEPTDRLTLGEAGISD